MRRFLGTEPQLREPDRQKCEPQERTGYQNSVQSAALTLLVSLGCVFALHFARELLVPIIIGILISYGLEPIVGALVARRVPRALAATLVFVTMLGGAGACAIALRPQAVAMIDRLPDAAQHIRATVERYSHAARSPVAQVERAAEELKQLSASPQESTERQRVRRVQVEPKSFDLADYMWVNSVPVLALIGDTVVVLFLAFYLLLAGDLFRRRFVEIAGPTLSRMKMTLHVLDAISAQISAYLFVRFMISVIVAVATGLAFWAAGLAQPAAWGVLAGALNVIPYFGPTAVIAASGITAFLQFNSVSAATTIGALAAAIAFVEAYVLTPMLTSRAAHMNPAAVFVGLVFWGWVWGLPGLLLAMPLLMILRAIGEHVEALQPLAALLRD